MRSLMNLFIAVSLASLLPALAFAATAYEAPPGTFVEKSFGVSAYGEYFTSRANYEASRGSYTKLPFDNNIAILETRLRGRYTFSRRFSAFAGTSYSNVRVVDPVNTKTNSQVTEVLAGANYLMSTRFAQLIPEVLVSLPMDATNQNQVVPLTSDGVAYSRVGVFAQKGFRRIRLGGFSGFHIPFDGLAKRFLYEAAVDMRAFSAITIGGGINGYEPLIGETETLQARQATASRAMGGSERFYSYNPSLIEARAWLGYRPSSMLWLKAGFGKTLNGLHTAEGQSFLLSVVYNSKKLELLSGTGGKARNRLDPDEAAKTFEPAYENTDQSVFQPEDEEEEGASALDSTERMLEKKREE